MAQSTIRTAFARGTTGVLQNSMRRILDIWNGIRRRTATHDALDGLSDRHLRDVGLTPADRGGLSSGGLDAEDLARRAGVRAGNW